jgi:aminotransferase
MWERTISCSSLSKTYSITGWRLGNIIAPEHIVDAARKVHDFLTVGAAAPLQEAALVGLKFGEDYYKALLDKYTHKRELFCKGLDDLNLTYTKPQGAYYVMVDIGEFGYADDYEFAVKLCEKIGVGGCRVVFSRKGVNHSYVFHLAK